MSVDFETRVGQLFTESVDARLGARREPPAFDRQHSDTRRTRRWTTALVAAACVALVAISTGIAVHLLTRPSNSASPAGTHFVHFESASIAVPRGWTTTLEPTRNNYGRELRLCFTRTVKGAGKPVFPANGCPTYVATVRPPSVPDDLGPGIDVDIIGWDQDIVAQYCAPKRPATVTEQSGIRDVGGRAADWRRWSFTCPGGRSYHPEQYVVDTAPGFAVFSSDASPAVHRLLAGVAKYSTLPKQTASLPFMDRGIVRDLRLVPTGWRVVLERTELTLNAKGQHLRALGHSATYVVPHIASGSGHIRVGEHIVIETDGRFVYQVLRDVAYHY